MDEHWMPLTWLDDMLNSVPVDSDTLLLDFDIKDDNDNQHTDQEPAQPFANCADHRAAIMQRHEEYKASRFELDKREATPPTPTIPQIKPRNQPPSKSNTLQNVRSDTSRRMEIAQLKLEVPKLQAYVEYLMQKAVSQSDEHSSLHKRQLVNNKLRELTRLQQLWITRGLSVASHMASSTTLLNYDIHLPREVPDRVGTLCDLSAVILRDGREILRERMHFLSGSLLPCNEVSSSTTTEGDMCASVFAATPIEGATNVKQVLDALWSVLTSDMDLVCQKTTGPRSIIEAVDAHPDLDRSGIAHRLGMRWSSTGVVTEFNGVLFSEYRAGTESSGQIDKQAQATIVIHPVEDDKLHPYTAGRMRLDATSVISIHHQKYAQGHEASSHGVSVNTEGVVVVSATFVKLHRGGVSISASELRREMNFAVSNGPAVLEVLLDLLARQ